MATTDRRYPAITIYDAALCAVFGALASAGLTLAVHDSSWTQGATPCAHQITADARNIGAYPAGVVSATDDQCHP